MIETATFMPDPTTVRRARLFVVEGLDGHDPAVVDNVALMTSELVTNAIHYSSGVVTLVLEIDADTVRVTVHDTATTTPTIRSPLPNEPSGRGLRIVAALADDWGITPNDTPGNTVWFTVRHRLPALDGDTATDTQHQITARPTTRRHAPASNQVRS